MPPTLTEEKIDIKAVIDRAAIRHRKIQLLKPLEREQEIDKALIRDAAKGKDVFMQGYSESCRVEQKPDTIARVVADEDVLFVAKTAGPHLTDLFTLHPSKGKETSFELNALKLLAKKAAQALLARLKVPATAHVRF